MNFSCLPGYIFTSGAYYLESNWVIKNTPGYPLPLKPYIVDVPFYLS